MYPSMHWARVCVYPSMHWTGGVSAQGVCVYPTGCLLGGMSTWGWYLLGECLPRLGSLPHTPPLWTEWQTPVKILPCHNYIADGDKQVCCVWDTWENLPVFCRMLTYPRVIYIKTTKQWNKNHWKKFFFKMPSLAQKILVNKLYIFQGYLESTLLNLT